MADRAREESEERVVAAVKEWLPTLPVGAVVHVKAIDPDENGAHFSVAQSPGTFACSRGSDRGSR